VTSRSAETLAIEPATQTFESPSIGGGAVRRWCVPVETATSDAEGEAMQKITPNLWFDTEGEAAASFYVSLFENSKIVEITRYGDAGPREAGTVMTVTFQLDGEEFVALNGGPEFKFTEAVSLQVNCDSQDEVDRLWDALAEGGEIQQCGWLKDRYGLSWQIVPTVLSELVADADPVKSQRVMQAMLGMKKLDIAELERAYKGA
jgi:predicted 3-demethylubiquinone-9 3-methyltransferase (glyoxalase superfamily)